MDDADQKLWDILGRAPRPEAPPFFAARVMRTVEAAESPKVSWLDGLTRWLAPAAIAALVLLAVIPRNPSPETAAAANGEITALDLVEIVSPDDYAVLIDAGWPYDNGFLSASL